MVKEVNPVTAQRRADKAKEIAKSRKTQQASRNEKLARRDPERLQRQVDELKELETRGVLRPKDKETLGQLERDLKAVRKAREVRGMKDEPRRGGRDVGDGRRGGLAGSGRVDVRQEQRDRRQQQSQYLGKRIRDEADLDEDGGSDTDTEVRSIPMPRDTPPPIPREHYCDPQRGEDGQRRPHALPTKPVSAAPRTVYSSAPQIRDLKKEAVKFMPAVVAQQRSRMKGQGRLLEPEELDKLEQSGYAAAQKAAEEAGSEAIFEQVSSEVRVEGGADLEEEARRFEEELGSLYPQEAENVSGGRRVEMEEVEDEGT